jgi:hypothetical protein
VRDAVGPSDEEFIMAFVRVEQRNAHLAGNVRLVSVEGRDGPISKATLTAISNTRRGSGDNRGEEATAILWTLWGKQADNAAQYLAKGRQAVRWCVSSASRSTRRRAAPCGVTCSTTSRGASCPIRTC